MTRHAKLICEPYISISDYPVLECENCNQQFLFLVVEDDCAIALNETVNMSPELPHFCPKCGERFEE